MSVRDHLEGATVEQRVEALKVLNGSELTARYMRPAIPGPLCKQAEAERLNVVGDLFRCQIGTPMALSGAFERRNADGSVETVRWHDENGFVVAGFGPTFTAAMEMVRRRQNGKDGAQ